MSECDIQEISAFLKGYSPEVRAISLRLREIIMGIVPGVIEQIDRPAKLLGYGFATTYKDTICVIMPLKQGVNLGFPRGTDLSDPENLLAGTGKRARHVKISSVSEAERPAVRALIGESVRLFQPKSG